MNDLSSTVIRSMPRFVTSSVANSVPASVVRSLPRVACLLALSSILTGCTPEQDEPVLPYTPNASNATVQLFNATPADIRHHERLAHTAQSRRHSRPAVPEAPAPIN